MKLRPFEENFSFLFHRLSRRRQEFHSNSKPRLPIYRDDIKPRVIRHETIIGSEATVDTRRDDYLSQQDVDVVDHIILIAV